jgi:hypothetical protein
MTAQIVALVLYIVGSLCFVAGSVTLLVDALK